MTTTTTTRRTRTSSRTPATTRTRTRTPTRTPTKTPTRTRARAKGEANDGETKDDEDERRRARDRVKVRFIDGATGDVIETTARAGENVLTLASAANALDVADDFCLEGRCGTCSMEQIDCESGETLDVILACRTCVESGSNAAYRINRNVRVFGDDAPSTWSTW